MVFKHIFFDLDFRNDSIISQSAIVDTFFQAHTLEFWNVSDNEVMFGVYDENNKSGATRFTAFDVGVNGMKGNLSALKSRASIATFVLNNKIIKMKTVDDRIILIQYVVR